MDIDIQSKLDFYINLQVETSLPSVKFLNANVKMINEDPWNCTLHFSANSSIPDYQKIILGLEYLLTTRSGHVSTVFDVAQTRGEFQSQWFWAAMEKMYLNTSTSYETNNISKHATLIGFYTNPRQSFKQFTVGVDVSLNRDAWAFGTNVALALPSTRNMGGKFSLKLPSPQPEIHAIEGKLEYLKDLSQMSQMLQYTTLNSRDMYITSGEGSITKGSIDGWCKFEWGKNQLKTINNILNVTRHDNLVDVTYRLETPRYKEDTLVTKVFYDYIEKYHKIRAQLYSPSSQYITGGKIDYNSFSNMNGTVNTTTPFEALPNTGINFETVTQSLRNKRFVEAFWPNNTAFLDSEYTYKTKDTNTHIVGAVLIELPITTRHIGKMDYEYKGGPQHTIGLATVEYNKAKFLEGKYSCESQSRAGFEKDIMNIEIENSFSPIGINYIHDLSYNAGSGGSNLPIIDKKHAQLFNLHNITIFNLTGEVLVKTRETGKDITLTGTHTNRTVTLKTNYDFLDHEFRQKSHWELAPHVWATYNVVINNKTTKEKREQHIELDMAYPRRDFSMKGYYQILNNSLSSEIAIQWDKKNVTKKSIGASIDWKRISLYPNKQHAVLSIKHPSFKRDVTFNANYLSGDKEFVDIASEVVYSTENNKKLRLSGKLLDNSQNHFKQYDYELLGNHPATRLDLKVFGDIHAGNGLYKSNNVAQYKRTYLPLQKGETNAFLNTVIKEIEIEKITQREHSFLKGKYEGKSPLYTITGAVRNGTSDLDSTSIFFINIEEKLIVGTVNFTPDATESFHMYGIIPDARNAKFNAWRNYEDDSISDVSYYLRLNHSHLVTSKLIWRPEIEYEVKSGIEEMYSALWNSILESVDYWKVYLASETNEAIHDVWLDAKPVVQRFLDDISELKVIADDFEEFKLFLNNSYNANEFYVRDIVGLATYVIDEFSLRRHIDFVPGIVNEMWDIMGESGKAVHQSILWIIETIKTSYQKAVAFINGILKGESSGQISEIFQGFVQKYDKFIKELHVSFVKHLEELWHGLSAMVQHHWNTMLETIEPTFIHLIHYLEVLSWKASKEILAVKLNTTSALANHATEAAQAVLAGPQHIITFDRKFIEYQGTCSYLLAADFVDHNFTLVISYDDKPKRGAYEISFIAGKKVVSVNIFNDEVTFQKGMSRLPLEFGDIYVYQETSMININSVRGFSLRCNLKFDTCTFTLSGWYFGKTAGLLGTMDNEPSTDFLTSQKTLETDIAKFAQSWLIEANKCSSSKNLATKQISGDPDIINQCDLFFKSKTSPFYTCFTVIRTSISPSSAVELNTTSALANYATEAGGPKTFHEDVFERPWSVFEPDLQFCDGLYADMFDGKHTLKDPRLMCQEGVGRKAGLPGRESTVALAVPALA
uniref:VWFD domain-containing protein n=1 Tax=Timema douglasi TaxID=61478 RepID=A0A7R8VGF4_TIMDO|nr:unnamed protein product [Timema douglasi]